MSFSVHSSDNLLNPKEYPNLLDRIEIASYRIFKTIEHYPLVFSQLRDPGVEWKNRFPMFVHAFYDFILKNRTIPTQEDFFRHYLALNRSFFSSKHFHHSNMEALKARAFRTYPSLVRDIYFGKYAQERMSGAAGEVVYNLKLDIEEGIDLLIIKDGKLHGVNLFTDTQQAHRGRRKKQLRHRKFDNVVYIDLPVNLRNGMKCGFFSLYGRQELDLLLKLIRG